METGLKDTATGLSRGEWTTSGNKGAIFPSFWNFHLLFICWPMVSRSVWIAYHWKAYAGSKCIKQIKAQRFLSEMGQGGGLDSVWPFMWHLPSTPWTPAAWPQDTLEHLKTVSLGCERLDRHHLDDGCSWVPTVMWNLLLKGFPRSAVSS